MIDYMDSMLRTWGIAKRRLDSSHNRWLMKPDKTRDKIPASGRARSFMGRLTEGSHVGRGKDGSPQVEPLDGLVGDALTVSIAIKLALATKSITERQYELLYVQYAVKTRNRDRFKYFRVRHHDYYAMLHNIQVKLSGWIQATEKRQAKQYA